MVYTPFLLCSEERKGSFPCTSHNFSPVQSCLGVFGSSLGEGQSRQETSGGGYRAGRGLGVLSYEGQEKGGSEAQRVEPGHFCLPGRHGRRTPALVQ